MTLPPEFSRVVVPRNRAPPARAKESVHDDARKSRPEVTSTAFTIGFTIGLFIDRTLSVTDGGYRGEAEITRRSVDANVL